MHLVHFLGSHGFDVWVIGFRGSTYSRGHKYLTTNDNEYWSFSFTEMGEYDLRSALELIKGKTEKKVLYIGFEHGTTASYAYSACKPDDAKDKLKGIISLAPYAYQTESRTYGKYILALTPILEPLIYATTHGEMLIPFSSYIKQICSYFPFEMYLCETLLVPIGGDDYNQMDPPDLPLIFSMNSGSMGIGVMLHCNQIRIADKFQLRDYGPEINYQKYGQSTPLPIELGKIPVPVTLIVGKNDWIATQSNAERIYSELSETSKGSFVLISRDKWNHFDFVRAKDIVPLLFTPLLAEIDKIYK